MQQKKLWLYLSHPHIKEIHKATFLLPFVKNMAYFWMAKRIMEKYIIDILFC